MIEGGIKKGLGGYLMPVGNIKIGMKGEEKKAQGSGKTWRQPIRLDHFIVTTTERGTDGNFLLDEAVMGKIGNDKPKEIRVRFPFDDPDLIFQTSYQMYNGKKLECQGNGEKAERFYKKSLWKKSGMKEVECDLEKCPHIQPDEKGNTKCKPSGRLACHLPDSPHYGGIYFLRSHGWGTVTGIKAALKSYYEQTGHILQGLPFRLIFTKKATEDHGNVPVIVLVMDGIELTEMRKLARTEREDRIEFGDNIKQIEHDAVASGALEDRDDPSDVAEEFYPPIEGEIEDGDGPDEPGATSEDAQAAIEEKDTEERAEPSEESTGGKKPDLF